MSVPTRLRLVGAAAVIFALSGMWQSAATLAQEARGLFDPSDPVLFRRVLYPLTWLYVASAIWQAEMGMRFMRGETGHRLRFGGLLWLQLLALFLAHALAAWPGLPTDLAHASSLALGGLLLQVFLLFPLWGPVLAKRPKLPVK